MHSYVQTHMHTSISTNIRTYICIHTQASALLTLSWSFLMHLGAFVYSRLGGRGGHASTDHQLYRAALLRRMIQFSSRNRAVIVDPCIDQMWCLHFLYCNDRLPKVDQMSCLTACFQRVLEATIVQVWPFRKRKDMEHRVGCIYPPFTIRDTWLHEWYHRIDQMCCLRFLLC